jgi:hypothetical protein
MQQKLVEYPLHVSPHCRGWEHSRLQGWGEKTVTKFAVFMAHRLE